MSTIWSWKCLHNFFPKVTPQSIMQRRQLWVRLRIVYLACRYSSSCWSRALSVGEAFQKALLCSERVWTLKDQYICLLGWAYREITFLTHSLLECLASERKKWFNLEGSALVVVTNSFPRQQLLNRPTFLALNRMRIHLASLISTYNTFGVREAVLWVLMKVATFIFVNIIIFCNMFIVMYKRNLCIG